MIYLPHNFQLHFPPSFPAAVGPQGPPHSPRLRRLGGCRRDFHLPRGGWAPKYPSKIWADFSHPDTMKLWIYGRFGIVWSVFPLFFPKKPVFIKFRLEIIDSLSGTK